MLYLLGVVLASSKWGLGPALMSTAIGAVVFDYLFIPPYLSVAVTETWYLITAITLMGVALVVSFLTNAVREQATAASRRAAHANALYSLTRPAVARRRAPSGGGFQSRR
jgi:two-component system, OmpR family, sensor histidine kinase KdpD